MSRKPRTPRRLLRAKQVMALMGWSRTTLWRRIRAGDFPAPVKTGPNSIGFYEDMVAERQAKLVQVTYAPVARAEVA